MIAEYSQYRDLDIIQDDQGDLFEVVGNIHPLDSVFIVPIEPDFSNKTNWMHFSSYFPPENIQNHEYLRMNTSIDGKIFHIPRLNIIKHWKPQNILSSWFSELKTQKTTISPKITKRKGYIIESALQISNVFKVPFQDLGVTGLDVFEDQNLTEVINLTIYGTKYMEDISTQYHKFRSQAKNIKSWLKIDLLTLAEQFVQDYQLPLEDCFEILYYQPTRFIYRHHNISLNFVPKLVELNDYPLYPLNFQLQSMGQCRIKAKVKNAAWCHIFPGFVELEQVELLEKKTQQLEHNLSSITQLLLFNRNFLHFFKIGKTIEIQGLVQKTTNNTMQILIGSPNSYYQSEYVRNILQED